MKRAQRGFTLIEMMVVVVIIGILVGTITFGLAGRDREEKLRTEAERLALLIEMARSEAVQRNEEWGLAIGPADYRFFTFDATRQRWVEQKGQPFHARTVADMALVVHVDAMSIPGVKPAQDVPSIIMFSSGEQTPFEVEITPAWKAQPWRVASDGLARTSAQRRA
jgi:general secretion pathway protein H